MKRNTRAELAALFLIINSMALGGCAPREADQLLVVQTMGLDRGPEGVALSLASAAAAGGGAPVRLQADGPSVTAAIEAVRAGSSEEDLFCAHIGQLLIGEAAARAGLAPLLDYVCRSDELRLSVPLYILREAEAREAVLGVGDGSFGVCDALRSVEADLRRRGDGRATPAADVLRGLLRRGSALVCAVALADAAEDDRSAEAAARAKTLVPAGYAVLKDGSLCGFLDRELAVGAGFLRGQTGRCELTVTDQAGLPVCLCLAGGVCRLEPQFDGQGALASLRFEIEAEAELAEGLAGDTEQQYLEMMLERALSNRVRQVLRLSQDWGADFLDLEGRLERLAPGRCGDFAARWPELPLEVRVNARLTGSGDREGSL